MIINTKTNEYLRLDVAHAVFYYGLPTIKAIKLALKQIDEDMTVGPGMVLT